MSILFAEVSPTAGRGGDGVILGSVMQSLFKSLLVGIVRCPVSKIYRMDRSAGALQITDETTAATAGTQNGWYPFGTAAQFSDNDEYAIGCDEEIQGFLVRVDGAGVHSAALRVFDCTDGVWATNELTYTGDLNGFKSAGWRHVEIPANAARQTWKPSSDPQLNVPAKKYFRFRLEGVVGGNTPPSVGEIVPIRSAIRFLDATSIANGDLNVIPGASNQLPWPEAAAYACFDSLAFGLDAFVYQKQTSVSTDHNEYLSAGGVWKPLTVTDPSNDLSNGPASINDPVEVFAIRWPTPNDWGSASISLLMENGVTLETVTGYWMRVVIDSVQVYGETPAARYRDRARQYGNASTTGWEMIEQRTIKGIVVLDATVPNTTAVECEIVNFTTGKSTPFTIPANPDFPVNVNTPDFIIPAGQRVGLRCVSGGTLRNAQIDIL